MAKLGKGYGSEWNLQWQYANAVADLDTAIREALGRSRGTLAWPYPARTGIAEPTSTDLIRARYPELLAAWNAWWPKAGTQPTWDSVGSADGRLILIEAKGNHPEFVGSPCGARSRDNRKQIERALGEAKAALGVHRDVSWLGSYYQYANRLAFLWFLNTHHVDAALVYVYFVGDAFPDGRWCPDSPSEWRVLLEARRLTLGLPKGCIFGGRVAEVFLPARRSNEPGAQSQAD